ncbi:hypothetical protein L3Q82_002986 [Scortum barcoo]|uniref:Uncharacterized protein n=1 Tax=Scortum barcoo TaxID=214431 RepID=A0ACB8VRP2_9TELE|nr:hypothetical protein L3Q82_002986 [Scortum barcoo]
MSQAGKGVVDIPVIDFDKAMNCGASVTLGGHMVGCGPDPQRGCIPGMAIGSVRAEMPNPAPTVSAHSRSNCARSEFELKPARQPTRRKTVVELGSEPGENYKREIIMLMMMKNGGMDAHQVDIDSEFEPHSRSRSCTWPLPCPEDFPGGEEASRGLALASVKVEQYNVPACRAERKGGAPADIKHPAGAPAPVVAAPACMSGAALDVAGQLRKAKSSRRNAWGNLSYADLITRAIESAPEKRLTLSQIYDWMVRFVPYFKDKGDSNSSAGWKGGCQKREGSGGGQQGGSRGYRGPPEFNSLTASGKKLFLSNSKKLREV